MSRINKRVSVVFIISLLFSITFVFAQEKGSRRFSNSEFLERLIRLEAGQKTLHDILRSEMESVRREMDSIRREMDSLRHEINTLRNITLTGFAILFSGMFIMVGFVIWDRRTILAPTIRELEELRRRQTKLESILKEYAEKVPELSEKIKSSGL